MLKAKKDELEDERLKAEVKRLRNAVAEANYRDSFINPSNAKNMMESLGSQYQNHQIDQLNMPDTIKVSSGVKNEYKSHAHPSIPRAEGSEREDDHVKVTVLAKPSKKKDDQRIFLVLKLVISSKSAFSVIEDINVSFQGDQCRMMQLTS